MSDWHEQYEARRAQQTETLKAAGFSEAFVAGSGFLGSMEFTSCRTCGAAIALTPLVEGEKHPLDLHIDWHKEAAR